MTYYMFSTMFNSIQSHNKAVSYTLSTLILIWLQLLYKVFLNQLLLIIINTDIHIAIVALSVNLITA